MVYYSQPFAISGLAGAPIRPMLHDDGVQSFGSSEIVEPVIRKTFPESWIYDDFKKYVFEKHNFDVEEFLLGLRFLNIFLAIAC